MSFLEYLVAGAIGSMVGTAITAYILCEQFKKENEEHCRDCKEIRNRGHEEECRECTAKRRGLI